MTEQNEGEKALEEKVFDDLFQAFGHKGYTYWDGVTIKARLADIITSVHRVEKQAGYKSPEEVAELLAHARDGYAKLDGDQTLPKLPNTDTPPYKCDTCGANHFDLWSYEHGRSDMLKANFKKIKQE